MIYMSEAFYKMLRDGYEGICLACLHVNDSVEPDAENYTCENCEAERVQGIDNLLIDGTLRFDDKTRAAYVMKKDRKTGLIKKVEIRR